MAAEYTMRGELSNSKILQFILSHCNKRLGTGDICINIVYICFKVRGFFKI